MALRRNTKLLMWELGCVFWICFAGSSLHFAFELSDAKTRRQNRFAVGGGELRKGVNFQHVLAGLFFE